MSSGIDPSHDHRHNFLGGLGRAGGGVGGTGNYTIFIVRLQ